MEVVEVKCPKCGREMELGYFCGREMELGYFYGQRALWSKNGDKFTIKCENCKKIIVLIDY